MFNFQSFFNSKSKVFVVLIPFLILVIFSTIFFVNQNQSSQNKQNSLNFSSSNSQILSNNNSISTNNFSNNLQNSSQQSLNLNSQNSPINLDLKPLVADTENDVVVLEECDLAVKFNKNYGVFLINKNNVTLSPKPLEINPRNTEFNFTVFCTNDSKNFEKMKNEKQQENSKFYNKVKIEKMFFFPEYKGEVFLERNNSGTGLASMLETYYFLYNQKSYIVNFVTQGQNNQEKVNYDSKNLISPLFPPGDFQLQSKSQNTNSKNPVEQNIDKVKSLVADTEHDVVVLEECDLAVKFRKSEISVSVKGIVYILNNLIESDNPRSEPITASIECSDKSFQITKSGPFNDNLDGQKSFFQNLGIPQAQNLTQNFYGNGNSEYTFEFNKKYYRFFQVLRASKDYKFQFNSLAPSTPSVKL